MQEQHFRHITIVKLHVLHQENDSGLKSMVLIVADEQVTEIKCLESEPTKAVNLYVMKNGFKDNSVITVERSQKPTTGGAACL
jgi:hypothetical protein